MNLKDPLDYTEDELRLLNSDELQLLQREAETKEQLYNTEQLSLKLQINSLYGAMANRWFPLFNESMAQAITGNGRYFIRKLANYIENTLQNMLSSDKPYILSGDTDSVYFSIAPFMNMYKEKNPELSLDKYVDWADSFEKKVIQPTIKRCIADFSRELNAFNPSVIGADREIIADVAILCEKKRYLARVCDMEGTRYPASDPYIKIMGLDIIKSSTSAFAKKYLKESIPLLLDKDEVALRTWIQSVKDEFCKVDLNDIAMIGAAARLDYVLGVDVVPFGARAAIRHNTYIKEQNLDGRYTPIAAGDKAKRVFLIEPNKFNSNIISFTNPTFIDELDGLVDYDTQFLKSFLKPLELMTNSLNYNLQRETETLDDW